jgi:hypothetical protein
MIVRSSPTAKKLMTLSIAGAVAAISLTASAGRRTNTNVIIYPGNTGATGAMGTVRNSTDTKQLIGCELTGSANSQSVNCYARDSLGHDLNCWTDLPNVVEAAKALSSDSLIAFYVQDGYCTQLTVSNLSELPPKKL